MGFRGPPNFPSSKNIMILQKIGIALLGVFGALRRRWRAFVANISPIPRDSMSSNCNFSFREPEESQYS